MSYAPEQAPRYRQLLARREAELRELLRACTTEAAHEGQVREVLDFKDMALEESRAAVDEAQAMHALHELQQIQVARRRLDDGSYGLCLDCGEALAPQRLAALPFAAYCPACQQVHERQGGPTLRAALHG